MSGLRASVYRLAARSGLAAASRRLRPGAAVFCYHNVVPDALEGCAGDGPLQLGESRFRAQLEWIQSAYEVVPLAVIVDRLRRGAAVSGLAALTFDDAYQGVISLAIPCLRSLGVPATVFVVSEASRTPRPFWWDRLGAEGRLDDGGRGRCLVQLGGRSEAIDAEYPPRPGVHLPDMLLPATLSDIRSVLGSGIDAGSHTLTHPNLTAFSPEHLDRELAGSREALEEAFGLAPALVSFPYGLTNASVRQATERAGYHAGIALSFGNVLRGSDPFDLIRINVPATLSVDALACWAAGLRWRPPR